MSESETTTLLQQNVTNKIDIEIRNNDDIEAETTDVQRFYWREFRNYGNIVNGPILLYPNDSDTYNIKPIKDIYESRQLRCNHRISVDIPMPTKYIEKVGSNNHSKSELGSIPYMTVPNSQNVDYIWKFKGGQPTFSLLFKNSKIMEWIFSIFTLLFFISTSIPVLCNVILVRLFTSNDKIENEYGKYLIISQFIKLGINIFITILFGVILLYIAKNNDISGINLDYKMNRYLHKHYQWMLGLNNNLIDILREWRPITETGLFIRHIWISWRNNVHSARLTILFIGIIILFCLPCLWIEFILCICIIKNGFTLYSHEAKFVINDSHVFEEDIRYFIIDPFRRVSSDDDQSIIDRLDDILFKDRNSEHILYHVFNYVMIKICLSFRDVDENKDDKELLLNLKSKINACLNAVINDNGKHICDHNFNNIDICYDEYKTYKKLRNDELNICLSIYFILLSIVNIAVVCYKIRNFGDNWPFIFTNTIYIIICLFNIFAIYKVNRNYFNKLTKDHIFFMDPNVIKLIGKTNAKWDTLIVNLLCNTSLLMIFKICNYIMQKKLIYHCLSETDIPNEIINIIIQYIQPNISKQKKLLKINAKNMIQIKSIIMLMIQ